MPLFKQTPTIKRLKGGAPVYIFSVISPELLTDNELLIYGDPISLTGDSKETLNDVLPSSTMELPTDCTKSSVARYIFQEWLNDCSSQFVKPPSVDQCFANYVATKRTDIPIKPLTEEEQTSDWQYVWVPTHIEIESPSFRIVWAPLQKSLLQINLSEFDADTNIELQGPERTYTITSTRLMDTNDTEIPLSNNPTLRLDSAFNTLSETQREKYRKRVRDARLRAKLAKYRAEHMAQRYYSKFGVWPEEDIEEAQTEAEESSENDESS